jgi:hypothetical protein
VLSTHTLTSTRWHSPRGMGTSLNGAAARLGFWGMLRLKGADLPGQQRQVHVNPGPVTYQAALGGFSGLRQQFSHL